MPRGAQFAYIAEYDEWINIPTGVQTSYTALAAATHPNTTRTYSYYKGGARNTMRSEFADESCRSASQIKETRRGHSGGSVDQSCSIISTSLCQGFGTFFLDRPPVGTNSGTSTARGFVVTAQTKGL